MSNPPKDQGTRWESDIVVLAQAKGYKAWRLAEGGGTDPGDVVIETPDGDHYVVEAKHRTNLPVHAALRKALAKAAGADLPFDVTGCAVVWKRSIQKPGTTRRTPDGVVVVLSLTEWLELVGR